uniref:Uncharacterized protein n=1 Tax=Caenorhabditis japonica TaxID=281687 RepID=A0A8R1I5R5_CAEJA
MAAAKGRPPCLLTDNAPYHNRTREKPPTGTTRKDDVQKWLEKYGVPFSPYSTRQELLEVLKEYASRNGGKFAFTFYELNYMLEERDGMVKYFDCQLIYDIDKDGVMRGIRVEESDESDFSGDEIFGSLSEYEDDTGET